MAMTDEKKKSLSRVLVIIVILVSVYIMAGFTIGIGHMFWFLAVLNLVFGPTCLVFYLIEVKKGVFANVEDEQESD